MSDRGYDDAVFIQKCKRAAEAGRITHEQVVDCLIDTMPDLVEAVGPSRYDELREHIQREYVSAFKWQLDQAGLVLVNA